MQVGFIGLGNMGGHMAANVITAGHDVTVYDVREEIAARHLELGASWADGPRAVAEVSKVVLTSLPGPPQVRAVALGEGGILEGASPGDTFIDLSTSSPTLIREIHATYAEHGVHVLDAPVSGGTRGAELASLAVMVGGAREHYERVKPVLDAIGDKVTYVGDIGAGCIAKLVHNMTSICMRMAMAEGLSLGVKAGVDVAALRKVLQEGAFGQGHFLNHAIEERVFARKWEPASFALALSRKDLGLATELAREYDVPMSIAAIAEQEMIEALGRGWGDLDSSIFFRLQEERAGVELRPGQVGPKS